MRRWLLVAVVLSLAPVPLPAEDESGPTLYKWVDENGIAHYTTDPERIPETLRKRVRKLRPPTEPAREPAPTKEKDETWAEYDAPPEVEEETVRSVPFGAEGERPAASEAGPPPVSSEPPALDRRIAALEAEIEREQSVLKALISEPDAKDAAALANDPAFRASARRLPELQEELRRLREQRRTGEASSPPPEPEPGR